MTIGIEAERANNPVKTGVEHYAKQLILQLAAIDSENSYVLYLRTKPESWFFQLPKNFTVKVIPFPIFWTQIRISLEMLLHPVDVLFIPASALPLLHPKKSVITIHDTAWVLYPEAFTGFMRRYLHYSTMFAVRSASTVIAVSEATKKDLVTFYKVPESKVMVVPHGYEPAGKEHYELSPELAKLLPEKYVLFLSTIQPRKNLPGLISAFSELKAEHPELPHKLVVVGKMGWRFEESLRAIEAHKDLVVYLDHVADNDRWPIYRKADLFVHPSFYEGFGMWILEAFENNVAVAVSNNSSLPEVGGDAALYFDPHDKENMKAVIYRALSDDSLRAQLVEKGKLQLKKFSWEQCGRNTHNVLIA
jgi:glycosyltransferase involved in cell wall biosynthesis